MNTDPAKRRLSFLPLLGIIFFSTGGGPFGMEDIAAGVGARLAHRDAAGVEPARGARRGGAGRHTSSRGGLLSLGLSGAGPVLGLSDGLVELALFIPRHGPLSGSVRQSADVLPAGFDRLATKVDLVHRDLVVLGRQPARREIGWAWSALVAFVVVNLPFALLAVLGLPNVTFSNWFAGGFPDTVNVGRSPSEMIGVPLSVALWSYSGWECVSTFAGEVEKPARTVPLATLAAVPLVALLYLLPLGVALGASDWKTWNSESHTISQIAGEIVGPWLGSWMSLAIMASSWGMYNSLLLSNSRLPLAMAEDGLLPRWINVVHPTRQTPHRALLLCSAIYALFTFVGFRELVILDALVTAVTALLLFATLVVLRRKSPELPRPFMIPGGWAGVCLAGILLSACAMTLFYSTIVRFLTDM